MGCYSFAGIFKILNLTPPLAVEASSSERFEDTYPKASMVHLDFPANGNRPGLRLSWYDGGLMPPRPAGIGEDSQRLFRRRGEGVMYVGEKGILLGGFNGDNPRVYPESKKYPPQPRQQGEMRDTAVDQWIAACKGGASSPSDFEAQRAPTEAFLLGCLSQRLPNERFTWDTAKMQVTNSEAANRYIDPPYRSKYAG
jgi:hypothetical protein